VASIAVVRGDDDLRGALAPNLDHTVDCRRREVGPVGEDDDRSLDLVSERAEAAAKRRSPSALPLGALHRRSVRVELVRTGHDERLGRGALPNAFENGPEQGALLRGAEAPGRARCENDDL